MATFTTNLNLEKPAITENYDVLKINANTDKIDAFAANKMSYKGTVANIAALPASGNKQGDVYYVTSETSHYVYNGTAWVIFGGAPVGDIAASDVSVTPGSWIASTNVQAALQELVTYKAGALYRTTTLNPVAWSSVGAPPYVYSFSLSGITTGDRPILDVVLTGTYATDQAILEQWANIFRIEVAASNVIKIYSHTLPTISLPIQLLLVENGL